MSKLENDIISRLEENNIEFEVQTPVPLENYPWKTKRSPSSPKCDIFLPKYEIYVEVKGFMTYRAVSKLSFLSRQSYRYYIFQGTEPEWNPYIMSYLKVPEKENYKTQKELQSNLIDFQVNELINLDTAPENFVNSISEISLLRLKNYIDTKINEYKDWNGEWF